MIFINTSEQKLYFLEENTVKYDFKISTASNGLGCKLNSKKPLSAYIQLFQKLETDCQLGRYLKIEFPRIN